MQIRCALAIQRTLSHAATPISVMLLNCQLSSTLLNDVLLAVARLVEHWKSEVAWVVTVTAWREQVSLDAHYDASVLT